jgi:hypothetical protein
MQREKHLEFCRQCTHRKMNFKVGLVCDLTDKIADFEITCPTYVEDPIEKAKLMNQMSGQDEDFSKSEDVKLPSTTRLIFTVIFAVLSMLWTIYRCTSS